MGYRENLEKGEAGAVSEKGGDEERERGEVTEQP
jgi:hypothetical protein